MGDMISPPTRGQLEKYMVNRVGDVEVTTNPLFDSATYAGAAGQTELSFFTSTAGKTAEDTNMKADGQLPNPQTFLINSVSVLIVPTGSIVNGALTSATANQAISDIYDFYTHGVLQLTIGEKIYVNEGPLMAFPYPWYFEGFAAAADASTAAASQLTQIAHMAARGPQHAVMPMYLPSSQNFDVKLRWPDGARALPSGADAKVFVRLGGYNLRLSQ